MPASNYILESCAKTPKTIYTPIHPTPPKSIHSSTGSSFKAITEAFLHQSHAWNFSVLLNRSVCVCVCVCVTVFRATDKKSLSLGMNVKENVCKILV